MSAPTSTNGHGSADGRAAHAARRRPAERGARRGRRPAAARLGARRASRASSPAGSRPPTSTSATPTTSARACRACGCCARCTSAARCAGSATCPRRAAGAARRQPLRRQPHAGHDRLHARLLDLLRGRARLPPARPQPRALAARACRTCASTAPWPPRRRTPARRSRPARRCSSTRAATTRSTGPAGSATASTSAGARASSGSRSSRTCRSCPWWPSAARRPRCSSRAASRSPRSSASTACFRLKVLPISLALPWGLNVGDMLGHIPLPAKITVEALAPIHLREEFGARARRRRGLRPRRAADAGHARRARRRAPPAGDRMMRVAESIDVSAPPERVWELVSRPRALPALHVRRHALVGRGRAGDRPRRPLPDAAAGRLGRGRRADRARRVRARARPRLDVGDRDRPARPLAAAASAAAPHASSCACSTASPARASGAGSPSSLAARTVSGHLRRSLQQLKRQVEHEQLRVQAAERRQARAAS